MKRAQQSGWLNRQIYSAQHSLDQLPEWVKKAARFEGENHHQFSGKLPPGQLTSQESHERKVVD